MSIKVKIQQLRANNPELKAVDIAREIGVTPEYVRQILNELGLPTRIRKKIPKLSGISARETRTEFFITIKFDNDQSHSVNLSKYCTANDAASILQGLAGHLRHDKLLK